MAPVNKPKHQGKAVVAGASAGIFEICCTVSSCSQTGFEESGECAHRRLLIPYTW
jgi:hypothetical protein